MNAQRLVFWVCLGAMLLAGPPAAYSGPVGAAQFHLPIYPPTPVQATAPGQLLNQYRMTDPLRLQGLHQLFSYLEQLGAQRVAPDKQVQQKENLLLQLEQLRETQAAQEENRLLQLEQFRETQAAQKETLHLQLEQLKATQAAQSERTATLTPVIAASRSEPILSDKPNEPSIYPIEIIHDGLALGPALLLRELGVPYTPRVNALLDQRVRYHRDVYRNGLARLQQNWKRLARNEALEKYINETLIVGPKQDVSAGDLLHALGTGKKQVLVTDRERFESVQALINATPTLRGQLIVGILRSEAPWIGMAKMDHRIKRLTFILDTPKTRAEARSIYGVGWLPTPADLDSLAKDHEALRMQIARCPNCRTIYLSQGKDPPIADRIRAMLEELDVDDMAVLLAEHRDGELIFSDGSRLAMRSIRTRATYHVLGCNSYAGAGKQPGLVGATTDAVGHKWAIGVCKSVLGLFKSSAQTKSDFTQRKLMQELQSNQKPVAVLAANAMVSHPPQSQAA